MSASIQIDNWPQRYQNQLESALVSMMSYRGKRYIEQMSALRFGACILQQLHGALPELPNASKISVNEYEELELIWFFDLTRVSIKLSPAEKGYAPKISYMVRDTSNECLHVESGCWMAYEWLKEASRMFKQYLRGLEVSKPRKVLRILNIDCSDIYDPLLSEVWRGQDIELSIEIDMSAKEINNWLSGVAKVHLEQGRISHYENDKGEIIGTNFHLRGATSLKNDS